MSFLWPALEVPEVRLGSFSPLTLLKNVFFRKEKIEIKIIRRKNSASNPFSCFNSVVYALEIHPEENNRRESLLGGRISHRVILPAIPVAELMPNIGLALLWSTSMKSRGGCWCSGYSVSSDRAQAMSLNFFHLINSLTHLVKWRGHSSLSKDVDRTRREVVTVIRLSRWAQGNGRHGLSLTVGGIIVLPLVSYCLPQAGQPPVNKVLTRHGSSASMGAWGLEKTRQVNRNYCTKNYEEDKRNIIKHCGPVAGT